MQSQREPLPEGRETDPVPPEFMGLVEAYLLWEERHLARAWALGVRVESLIRATRRAQQQALSSLRGLP